MGFCLGWQQLPYGEYVFGFVVDAPKMKGPTESGRVKEEGLNSKLA